jgi:hypothetical protein
MIYEIQMIFIERVYSLPKNFQNLYRRTSCTYPRFYLIPAFVKFFKIKIGLMSIFSPLIIT